MISTYLATQIQKVVHEEPWFGSGLLQSLNKLTEEQWHQPLGHRTVAGIVGHLIAWRNFAIARLADRTDFGIEMNTELDWPDCSEMSKATLLQQLADTQQSLLANLKLLSNKDLEDYVPAVYLYNKGELAIGVMQHDIYHLGQINLLVSLLENE
ncbi:MAG: putative damage-inducible protein DinB [Neolewinella sp.]|jgi:uncharacterized damage-inducible protein DinB